MGKLTHPIVDTTAVTEQLGAKYQFWTLENPDTNAQSIFYNVNATATTTATQSVPVRPGQKAFFFVNTDENPNGVSLIAATAAQTVNLTKDSFRTRLGYNVAVFAAGVAASVANWWNPLAGSTTVLTMVGGRTTWRAVSGADAIIQNDQGNNGLVINDGANGDATLTADGTGNGAIQSSDATDAMAAGTARNQIVRNNVQLVDITDSLFDHINMATAPVAFSSGAAGTERHRFNATDRVMRMVGDGAANTVFDTVEMPIVNAAVVAAGDIVEFIAGANRVQAAALGSTRGVGVAITGGTGDAGGTVKATIRVHGVLMGFAIADTGGVTSEQRAIVGNAVANTVDSQAAIENTFARVLTTAIATAVTDLYLYGPK